MDLARKLVQEGLLTQEEFAAVLGRCAAFSEPVPVALRALGIDRTEALDTLFEQLGFSPALRMVPASDAGELPTSMPRTFWVLPLGKGPQGHVVAMADPIDAHVIRELEYHLKGPVDPRVADLVSLESALESFDPPRHTRPRPTMQPSVSAPQTETVPPELAVLARAHTGRRTTPAYGQRMEELASGPNGMASAQQTPGAPRSTDRPGFGTGELDVVKPPTAQSTDRGVPPPVPREALRALAALRTADNRDQIAVAAVNGLLAVAERAAFFVVRQGVVQGWEAAVLPSASRPISRDSLRNMWIPITTPSSFRTAVEATDVFMGPLGETTADKILTSAVGRRPSRVVLAPVIVRGHVSAILYADGLHDPDDAPQRAREMADAVAEALERCIVAARPVRR